jgi:hypothetical protein
MTSESRNLAAETGPGFQVSNFKRRRVGLRLICILIPKLCRTYFGDPVDAPGNQRVEISKGVNILSDSDLEIVKDCTKWQY